MMIKYKIQAEKPKYIHHRKLYTLQSRGTYYGIHRDMLSKNYDRACTKTALLLFIEQSHAKKFKDYIELQQKQNKMMDRIVNEDNCNASIRSTSLQPLSIDSIQSEQLEMLGLLHFFNLIIVNNVLKQSDRLDVYGYEFVTYDFPNRQILEYYLYKSFGKTNG